MYVQDADYKAPAAGVLTHTGPEWPFTYTYVVIEGQKWHPYVILSERKSDAE